MATLTRERIERVKAAFTDAADADAAIRQRIVERLERDDRVAAEMLRELLRTHDDPNDDLFTEPVIRLEEALAEPAAVATSAAPALGKRYRIIRLLGCGSVGDVYLAEEAEPISRKVAIKVFRPHRLDGTRLRRFGIEARALGTLSHPGIAQVFGAGEGADGRPYLAMEYVPGMPIDQACIEAGLDERQILRLFSELCKAAQHAHQSGIIHRDLKPSNVLVVRTNDALQVKIIDFGVAKLADEAGASFGSLTLHGQILGTLEYMSPEQWRGGQADTRSDVYSLAVILYRLLTKRMPFGDRAAMAARREAKDIRPEPMREASGWMRRDIETMIGKALAQDPAKRYASPLHMAEDVDRLLRGEPVLARRASAIERTAKLVRRNPWTSATAGVVLASVVTLVGHTAVSRQQLAREVELQQVMIGGLLDDVLDRLYVLTGAMETREALAHSLLERADQLLQSRPSDPDLLEARARLLMELGNIEFERYEDGSGEENYAEAVSILGELTATPHADVETWRRYADATVRYSYALWRRDYAAAAETHRKAHELLESLAQHHPMHPGVLDDLCWSYDRIPDFRVPRGARDDDVKRYVRRLEIAEAMLSLDEERILSHYNLMKAHFDMARHYFETRDEESLREHLQQAMAYGEHIIEAESARVHFGYHFVYVLILAGRTALLMNDSEHAEAHFSRADALTARLYRDNPENRIQAPRQRMHAMIEYAHAALTFADDDRVRELYLEAKELAERHPEHVTSRHRQLLKELDRMFAGDEDAEQ